MFGFATAVDKYRRLIAAFTDINYSCAGVLFHLLVVLIIIDS